MSALDNIEVNYSASKQHRSTVYFKSDKEGLRQAIRFVKKMENAGHEVSPSSVVLIHKLNHIK